MNAPPQRLKTYAYIDGFNLYYGFFKRNPPAREPTYPPRYKWLNLERFCELLFPRNEIIAVKYYTADVFSMPPDYGQKRRQKKYLKALSSLGRLEVVKGRFLGPSKRSMQRCTLSGKPLGSNVLVLKTEEKGSDVNLAVDLLHDGIRGLYECAVIVSNDSDLSRAIRIAREAYGRIIGIANPHESHQEMSWDLRKLAHFTRSMTEKVLANSQFPDEVTTPRGPVTRPPQWA